MFFLRSCWKSFILLLFPIVMYCFSSNITFNGINDLHLLLACFILLWAFIEEFIFRFFLPKLFGKELIHILIYSALFSLIHIFNDNFYFFAFINTFLISLVLFKIRYELGFKYAVCFHFLWNFIVAIAFAGILSGINFTQLMREKLEDYNSIFIGISDKSSYGIEGSWLLTLTLIVFFMFCLLYDCRRNISSRDDRLNNAIRKY